MKGFLLLIICFSFTVHSALIKEDVDEIFIEQYRVDEMLTIEEIKQIEDAFIDINQGHYFQAMMDKYGVSNIEGLTPYLSTCDEEVDAAGVMRRGQIKKYTSTLNAKKGTADLSIYFEQADIQAAIDKAYKTRIINNSAYVSLVLTEWPTICIRPGFRLGDILKIFAHEITHLVGDSIREFDILSFENEADYVEKRIEIQGGELDAFQEGAVITTTLQRLFDYETNLTIMKYFDDDANILDKEEYKEFVLGGLGYRKKYQKHYRDRLSEELQQSQMKGFDLMDYRDRYQESLDLHEGNVEIFEQRAQSFQNNIEYYEYYGDKEKVAELKKEVEQDKVKLQETKNSILFYQEMIKLVDNQELLTKEREEEITQKIKSNMSERGL